MDKTIIITMKFWICVESTISSV